VGGAVRRRPLPREASLGIPRAAGALCRAPGTAHRFHPAGSSRAPPFDESCHPERQALEDHPPFKRAGSWGQDALDRIDITKTACTAGAFLLRRGTRASGSSAGPSAPRQWEGTAPCLSGSSLLSHEPPRMRSTDLCQPDTTHAASRLDPSRPPPLGAGVTWRVTPPSGGRGAVRFHDDPPASVSPVARAAGISSGPCDSARPRVLRRRGPPRRRTQRDGWRLPA